MKFQIIEKLFLYIVTYSYLLIPLVFVLSGKPRNNKVPTLLFGYGVIFFSLLFVFINKWLPRGFQVPYVYFYTLLEYIFFASIFFVSTPSRKFKNIIILFSILFTITLVLLYFNLSTKRIDSVPIAIETILIFFYLFYVLFEKTFGFGTSDNTIVEVNITKQPIFWISVGILVYLGGSFFIFIIANHLSPEENAKYWFLNYIADTIKTIFFCVSIVLAAQASKEKQITKSFPNLDFTI